MILYVVMHEERPWKGSAGQVRAFTDLPTARKSVTQARKTCPECYLKEFSDYPVLSDEDLARIDGVQAHQPFVDAVRQMVGER